MRQARALVAFHAEAARNSDQSNPSILLEEAVNKAIVDAGQHVADVMNKQTDHRLRDNELFIEGWLDGFDKRHSSFMDYGE